MNIVHVNLAKGFRGGERQTVLLIEELSKRGCIQALVCRENSPMRDHLASVRGLNFITSNNQFMGHFSGFYADVVHAHEAKAVHWAYIHHVLKKSPYVITRRVDTPIKKRLSSRLTYNNAAEVVAISNAVRSELIELGIEDSLVIPSASSGFEFNEYAVSQIRKDYSERFVVGQVGALVDKHKGQLVTIEAARLLQKKYPNILFVFLGDGPDLDLLTKASEGLENVQLLGFKDNIGDYIFSLDAFVFPSRNEGLGSVLLDVMGCGIPIVAADVGGIPDVIENNKNGILIPAGDAKLLADAVVKIYENPDFAKRLVDTGILIAESHSSLIMSDRYFDVYKKILREL